MDPAQTRDFHVLSVIERIDEKLLLRHLKIFPHPTYDAYVLGYIKALQDRWGGFNKIRVDITREGPSFIADMENAGIDNAEGVIFSSPKKKRNGQRSQEAHAGQTLLLSAAKLGETLPRRYLQRV